MTEDIQELIDQMMLEIESGVLCYVASPFTPILDKSEFEGEYDYEEQVRRLKGEMVDFNIQAFKQFSDGDESDSVLFFMPILHTYKFDGNWKPGKGWYYYLLQWLLLSKKMRVLRLPGWEESFGVQLEIREAEKAGIAIEYWDLDLETGRFVKDLGESCS